MWDLWQGRAESLPLPSDSVDLVVTSPPYELARTYSEGGRDLGIARKTEDWVAFMVTVVRECVRVCKGLCVFVVEGQTRDYRYSCGPALLMADLHRAGFHLRNPPIYRRVGIPGSGGPDWWRNDKEWCVCVSRPGRLPWSDNTATGHAPKWAPGGEMSNRTKDGNRVNGRDQWGMQGGSGMRRANGKRRTHGVTKRHTKAKPNGTDEQQTYTPPVLANPGTVIQQTYTADEVAEMLGEMHDVVSCKVGGGQMGSPMSHANEAPYPEQLVEPFVLSFCPPGGIVLDCFGGSFTTGAVAIRHGRHFLGCDIRQSQVKLGERRLSQETPMELFQD